MRPLNRFVSLVVTVAGATVPVATICVGVAAADPTDQPEPNAAARVELGTTKRDCNFGPVPLVSATTAAPRTGAGTGFAVIGTTLNQVIAEVHLTNAAPNASYNVRLIELPNATCGPDAPGVAAGMIQTDPVGNGGVNLQTVVVPGATGAWVVILDRSVQLYTSNSVAPISTGR